MYDKKRILILKVATLILISVVLFCLGLIIGTAFSSSHHSSKEVKNQQQLQQLQLQPIKTAGINNEEVNNFLKAYFNRQKLGKNRKNYQKFMTTDLYQETIKKEEKPMSKAYADYYINQKLKSAQIYLNNSNLKNPIVLVAVKYVDTVVDQENSKQLKQENIEHHQNLVLTYKLQNNSKNTKYLLDNLEGFSSLGGAGNVSS